MNINDCSVLWNFTVNINNYSIIARAANLTKIKCNTLNVSKVRTLQVNFLIMWKLFTILEFKCKIYYLIYFHQWVFLLLHNSPALPKEITVSSYRCELPVNPSDWSVKRKMCSQLPRILLKWPSGIERGPVQRVIYQTPLFLQGSAWNL